MRPAALLLACSFFAFATAAQQHTVVRFADLKSGDETEEVELDDLKPMPVPQNLPVPFVFAPATVQYVHVAKPEVTSTATVVNSFAALGDDNTTIPPDCGGAVGRNQLLVALNSQLQVQARDGSILKTATTKSLFDGVRNNNRTFDPRVLYDPRLDRWYVAVISDGATRTAPQHTASAVLVGISRTADALGAWDTYRFEVPSNTVWYDYPSVGFDAGHLVVSLNEYNTSDDKFFGARIFLLDKTHPDQNAVGVDVTSFGGTLVPATSYDASSPATYLIQKWNANFQGSGFLRLYTIDAGGLKPVAFVQTPHPWANQGASNGDDFAPQAGTTQKIDAGDDRLQGAYFRNGSIWTVHTVFLPTGTPTHAAVQWWQVSTSAAVQQSGLVEDPQNVFFYAFPSIAVNGRGDVMIGGTQFSATSLPSAFITYRSASDADGATAAPMVFKTGESSYTKIASNSNRWGDYTTTSVDPVNDTDFWSIQEYAATPNSKADHWGTWWVHVQVAPLTVGPKHRASRH